MQPANDTSRDDCAVAHSRSILRRGGIAGIRGCLDERWHRRLSIVVGYYRRLVLEGDDSLGDAGYGFETIFDDERAGVAEHVLHRERDGFLTKGSGYGLTAAKVQEAAREAEKQEEPESSRYE